jgi:Cd2+/Zn2+-exporting ATPase
VDGGVATLGNHRWFDEVYPHSKRLCHEISALEASGQSTVLVHFGDRVRGYLAFSDTARPESRETVRWLQDHGRAVVLLSGDHTAAAQAMAEELGIQEVHASLLPQDKLALLQRLRARYGGVAMVGDGVNDAPALSAAQVGIAVGGVHSAQAMETADIVLMDDTLKGLPFIFRLAEKVHRLVRQNVAFSLITKLAFLILAVLGQATMWLAVLADMGVSLLVVFNGMRPLALAVHPERK